MPSNSKFQAGIPKALVDSRTYIRSAFAETLLEDFFIAAVAAVICIRFYLWATGYPQIGGGGLHVAHVLFGGIMMLIAIIILLAFITHNSRRTASIVGGVGFGTFIDELGKFITSDNNYFYEPAMALIYLIFILLYFGIRFIIRRQALSREERLINALDIAQNASAAGINFKEAQLVEELVKNYENSGLNTFNLKLMLKQVIPENTSNPLLKNTSSSSLDKIDQFLARRWRFFEAIIIFFALITVTPLYLLLATVQWSWVLGLQVFGCALVLTVIAWFMRNQPWKPNILLSAAIIVISLVMALTVVTNLKPDFLSVANVIKLIFPSVSGVLMVIGLLLIPFSHTKADKMFARATMISIFFTQLFAFYQYQLLAVAGLMVNIITIMVLRHMIMEQNEKLSLNLTQFQDIQVK